MANTATSAVVLGTAFGNVGRNMVRDYHTNFRSRHTRGLRTIGVARRRARAGVYGSFFSAVTRLSELFAAPLLPCRRSGCHKPRNDKGGFARRARRIARRFRADEIGKLPGLDNGDRLSDYVALIP